MNENETQTKSFESFFPCNFSYENQNFTLKMAPFGNRPEERWVQIRIVHHKREEGLKRVFSRTQENEVGTITLKLPSKSGGKIEIMGNYKTNETKNQVKGIVGFAIQKMIDRTGYPFEVKGLTDDGLKMYQRLVEHARDTLDIQESENGVFTITPKSS